MSRQHFRIVHFKGSSVKLEPIIPFEEMNPSILEILGRNGIFGSCSSENVNLKYTRPTKHMKKYNGEKREYILKRTMNLIEKGLSGKSRMGSEEFEELIEGFTVFLEDGIDEHGVDMTKSVLKLRGEAYARQGDFGRAHEDFSACLALDPNQNEVYESRSRVLVLLNDFERAYVDLTILVDRDPNNFEHYSFRGMCNVVLKNYKEALSDYSKAIELGCSEAQCYFERGKLLYDLDEFDRAVLDFNKAIELSPNPDSDYYFWRARCLGRNRYKLAFTNYRKALNVNPNDRSVRLSFSDFNKAISIEPTRSEYYFFRGILNESVGDSEKALSDYSKTIELGSSGDSKLSEVCDSYCCRGRIFKRLRYFEQSLENFNRAIELDPVNSDYYVHRARALQSWEKYDLAVKDYNRAIELSPLSPVLYELRGIFYHEIGNYEKAIEDLTKLYKMGKISLLSIFHLGDLHKKTANFVKANEMFKEGFERNSTDPEVYRYRSFFLRKSDPERSADDMRKYEEETKDDPTRKTNDLFEVDKRSLDHFMKYKRTDEKSISCSFFERDFVDNYKLEEREISNLKDEISRVRFTDMTILRKIGSGSFGEA